MKTLTINGYAMAYLEIGDGAPLLCIHGSLGDFRSWMPVLKPLSAGRRLFVPSLRRCFPEHWDGQGGGFSMDQHIADVITFIETLAVGPVDLIGHSRGGYLAFRLAQHRPDLVDRLVLAEPGGSLDASLQSGVDAAADNAGAGAIAAGSPAHMARVAELLEAGDLDGGLREFIDVIGGVGTWDALPPAERQMRIDNALTLVAQQRDVRQPYSKSDAQSLTMPTLFVGGANTPGIFPVIVRALAAHVDDAQIAMIADAGHSMVKQQPAAFCDAVLRFLER